MTIISGEKMFIMSGFMEEKIAALSTFFLPHPNVTMSSKSTKKSNPVKNADLFVKKIAAAKKETPKKTVTKKKRAVTSSEESSSESSSEDEPPKKSKKKVKSKKVVSSSSESSSEDSSEDEIVVETIPKKETISNYSDISKLNDGLLAIAAQFAEANANQTKILELLAGLFTKMEVRNAEKETDDDLLATIDDVVTRGESIVIGNNGDDAVVHHFESIGHLRQDSGRLADKSNFTKAIDNLRDDDEVDVSALA